MDSGHATLADALPDDIKEKRKQLKNPVHRLAKPFYGRTRSGFGWSLILQAIFAEMGFKKTKGLNGIFYHESKDGEIDIILASYVDDCVVAEANDTAKRGKIKPEKDYQTFPRSGMQSHREWERFMSYYRNMYGRMRRHDGC